MADNPHHTRQRALEQAMEKAAGAATNGRCARWMELLSTIGNRSASTIARVLHYPPTPTFPTDYTSQQLRYNDAPQPKFWLYAATFVAAIGRTTFTRRYTIQPTES